MLYFHHKPGASKKLSLPVIAMTIVGLDPCPSVAKLVGGQVYMKPRGTPLFYEHEVNGRSRNTIQW